MGNPFVVDGSFFVALWRKNDQNHPWAVIQARKHPPPWIGLGDEAHERDIIAPELCS